MEPFVLQYGGFVIKSVRMVGSFKTDVTNKNTNASSNWAHYTCKWYKRLILVHTTLGPSTNDISMKTTKYCHTCMPFRTQMDGMRELLLHSQKLNMLELGIATMK